MYPTVICFLLLVYIYIYTHSFSFLCNVMVEREALFLFFVALQLHPDKNTHPKAEFAFKIVSEVYLLLLSSQKSVGNVSCFSS